MEACDFETVSSSLIYGYLFAFILLRGSPRFNIRYFAVYTRATLHKISDLAGQNSIRLLQAWKYIFFWSRSLFLRFVLRQLLTKKYHRAVKRMDKRYRHKTKQLIQKRAGDVYEFVCQLTEYPFEVFKLKFIINLSAFRVKFIHRQLLVGSIILLRACIFCP